MVLKFKPAPKQFRVHLPSIGPSSSDRVPGADATFEAKLQWLAVKRPWTLKVLAETVEEILKQHRA